MESFLMNGYLWRVKFVEPDSQFLVDRTNRQRMATTDPRTQSVYLSNRLTGSFKKTVLLHELGHCVMFSYGLVRDIHRVVDPENWIEAEEWVCNFIADYGGAIFETAYEVLGDEAWECIPNELGNLIA